jgi:hypothetical protein
MLLVENRHREGRSFLMDINETICACVHKAYVILTVKKKSPCKVCVIRHEVRGLRICLLLFVW